MTDGWMDRQKERRSNKERKVGRRENPAVKWICIIFFLFIRHALTFEGMKIISRISGTVGIGGGCWVDNGTL